MNILLIHPHDIFDKSEPWTIRIKSIGEEFAKSSHKVRLCYFPVIKNQGCSAKQLGAIDLVPLDRTPSPLSFYRNTKRLIDLSKWADIVHFQKCHHYAAVPATIAAYVNGKTLHYDWDDWEEKIWYESCGRGIHSRFIGFSFKVLERLLPLLADSVSCASDHLKWHAVRFGVQENIIVDTPVGADLEKFHPATNGEWVKKKYSVLEGEDLVLYIGQLHGAQYVDLFIKAANVILHKESNVKFMIVGEGFLEPNLRKLVYNLGLEEKVIFTGAIEHDDIPYYVAAASVCVAPFRDTDVTRCKSPLKIVEYMAAGKAIVASNVGEVRKMLGGAGIITEPGDWHALTEGILIVLKDKALRANLGKAARHRAEKRYNWPKTASVLVEAYHRALEKK